MAEQKNVPKSWLDLPECPDSSEVRAIKPNIPELFEGSKRDYLENQHSILRHEGTEPLRRAVTEYRSNPSMKDNHTTFVYTNVHVLGYTLSRLGALCRVGFSTERSPTKINWLASTRLTPGTLVALSPKLDNFRALCLVATVACRTIEGGLMPGNGGFDKYGRPILLENPMSTPPRIDILWAKHDEVVIDPCCEYVMIESRSGYYESVRHAMLGLKEALSEESPLDKYVTGNCHEVVRPKYLQNFLKHRRNGMLVRTVEGPGRLVRVEEDIAQVMGDKSPLDSSQLTALEMIKSSEMVLIQGPPGTGKTFTSIAALHMLVDSFNLRHREGEKSRELGPIIVAAQSNFAIDQLLRHTISSGLRVIRLGGRSQVPEVQERTLFRLRNKFHSPAPQGYAAFKSARANLKKFLAESDSTGLVNLDELREAGLVTAEQLESLTLDVEDFFDLMEEGKNNDGKPTDRSRPTGRIAEWLGEALEKHPGMVYRPPQHQTEPNPDEADTSRGDFLQDDEEDKVRGVWAPLNPYWTGSIHQRYAANWRQKAQQQLRDQGDLYQIPLQLRGAVYRYLREGLRALRAEQLRVLLGKFEKALAAVRKARVDSDVVYVRRERIAVIGCTTTGLSKYRDLLSAIGPKVMLIEEAAETWEANVTSALVPSVQQLILVGDHVQLSPHCDVEYLRESPFYLDRSLFERLINEGRPHLTLRVQRRMAPEIRQYISSYYPTICDHELVRAYPPVPGTTGRVFFHHHVSPEVKNANNSMYNLDEAKMVAGLFRHLVMNGTPHGRITVLTFYRAQRGVILDQLRKDAASLGRYLAEDETYGDCYNVRTVDSYQGEENDVIILSLVRSGASSREPNVGFLRNSNRVVVSLSRARRGLYLVGNALAVMNDTEAMVVWGPVFELLVNSSMIDNAFPITCRNHGNRLSVENHEDWWRLEGGCAQPCEGPACASGHRCKLPCHPGRCSEHRFCREACEETVACGHRCGKMCFEECECTRPCAANRNRWMRGWKGDIDARHRADPGPVATPRRNDEDRGRQPRLVTYFSQRGPDGKKERVVRVLHESPVLQQQGNTKPTVGRDNSPPPPPPPLVRLATTKPVDVEVALPPPSPILPAGAKGLAAEPGTAVASLIDVGELSAHAHHQEARVDHAEPVVIEIPLPRGKILATTGVSPPTPVHPTGEADAAPYTANVDLIGIDDDSSPPPVCPAAEPRGHEVTNATLIDLGMDDAPLLPSAGRAAKAKPPVGMDAVLLPYGPKTPRDEEAPSGPDEDAVLREMLDMRAEMEGVLRVITKYGPQAAFWHQDLNADIVTDGKGTYTIVDRPPGMGHLGQPRIVELGAPIISPNDEDGEEGEEESGEDGDEEDEEDEEDGTEEEEDEEDEEEEEGKIGGEEDKGVVEKGDEEEEEEEKSDDDAHTLLGGEPIPKSSTIFDYIADLIQL